MAGIKISDLPPNTLPLVGDEQLELENANGDSTKATVQDIASAASGLDATFITVSANAALPNERVLTEGTNISFVDTGPNGTLTINAAGLSFPLLAPDGSAGAPSYSFSGETDMGIFRLAEDIMGFSMNGITRIVLTTSGITGNTGNSAAIIDNGATATIPSLLAANGDTNTGLGWGGIDILTLIAGGVEMARLTESPGANQFAIVQSGASTVPELTSTADLDTGFRWTGGNQLTFIGSGSRAWHFTSARFFSEFSQGPALLNVTAQDDVPTVLADQSDSDTGIGSSGNDELSIIAGGVEGIRVEETAGNVFITYFGPILTPFGSGTQPGAAFNGDDDTGYFRPVADAFAITAGGVESVRYAELSSRIIQTNAHHVGLTASVTQTQAGGLALLSSYNEVAIVGTTGDALTAFGVKEGDRLTVINNGANDLQLFPAVGDDIGAGVDAAITIVAGEVGIFLGRDSTNWDTLYNGPSTIAAGGDVFKVGTPVDNQVGVWTGDGTIEGDPNFTWDGASQTLSLGAGSSIFAGSNTYFFQDGNLSLDGESTIIPVLSIIQGGINNQAVSLTPTEMVFNHDAGGLVFKISGNLARWEFETALRVMNSAGTDWIEQDHDGTDYNFAANLTADINFTGLTGRIMQDAETLAFLSEIPSLPTGTVTNSILRFDGADFVETTQYRATVGVTGFQVFDAGLTDNVSIGHDGSIGLINTIGSTEVVFGLTSGPSLAWRYQQMVRVPDGSAAVPGITWFGDAATGIFRQALGLSVSITGVEQARFSNATTQIFSDDFRLQPNIGADLARFIVNGPSNLNDFEIELTSLIDFHVSGSTGERFVLEEFNLAMVEKSAAPADVATVGQFWVRDDVPNIPMYTDDTGIDFKLGVANDAVQARRTTSYVLTTAFADVTLDTTDIETDDQIIEHSGTTDNIEALVAGTYEVTYGVDIDPSAAGNDNIRAFGRMRLNDAGVDLPGSLASQSAYEDASTIGNQVFGRLQCSFIVVLAISDFVTLQLMKVETGGTGIFTAEEVTVTAKRLL